MPLYPVVFWVCYEGSKTIPYAPTKVLLEKAYLRQSASPSKGGATLYIRTESEGSLSDYTVKIPNNEIRALNLLKGKKILIAIEPNTKKTEKFIWEIYDDSGYILLSNDKILSQIKEDNLFLGLLFSITASSLIYFIYWFIRYAILNRILTGKDANVHRRNKQLHPRN